MPRMPPENWVSRLRVILSRNGIFIDDTVLSRNKRNVFLAGWKDRSRCIVAASSTRIGFWGIQKSTISTLGTRGHDWGALFIDMRSSGKCYWVDAPNVTKVSDSSNADEYLFHASVLEENRELAHKIDGKDEADFVRNFLSVAGLEVDK